MALKRSDSFEKVLATMAMAQHRVELSYRQRIEKLSGDVLVWRKMYEDECRRNRGEAI